MIPAELCPFCMRWRAGNLEPVVVEVVAECETWCEGCMVLWRAGVLVGSGRSEDMEERGIEDEWFEVPEGCLVVREECL